MCIIQSNLCISLLRPCSTGKQQIVNLSKQWTKLLGIDFVYGFWTSRGTENRFMDLFILIQWSNEVAACTCSQFSG